jgi:glyceraldehyde 3-phosphate dehydrogenase
MVNVAINGFGRIGRLFLKAVFLKHPEINITAINDLTDAKTLAYLLKFDSVHGKFPFEVQAKEKSIIVKNKEIPVLSEADPEKIDWSAYNTEIVLEATGVFRKKEQLEKHLKGKVKHVLLTAPPKSDDINQFVLGVNEEKFNPKKDKILSNASCTTNCLAPLVLVLHKEFGIQRGFMTTVHAVTLDQKLLDAPHKDLRRARAAISNIVPTSTGAAKAVTKVFPELEGKLDGIALRVPVPNASVTDFVALLNRETTVEEVNKAFKKYAEGKLKGILEYSEDELVSTDIIGREASSVFDSKQTMVKGNLVKVLSWYDNEFGYALRLADFISFMAKKI